MSLTDDETAALCAELWVLRDNLKKTDELLIGTTREAIRLRAENERLRAVDPEREKRIEAWLDGAMCVYPAAGHVGHRNLYVLGKDEIDEAVALMRSAPRASSEDDGA